MLTIGDILRHNARRIPHGEAVISADERLSWGQLDECANRLGNALLGAGVEPGDCIAFSMGNTVDIVRVYYAIAKIGCIAVPIMPRSVAREIIHIADDVAATVVIAGLEQAPAVEEALASLPSVKLAIGTGTGHGLGHDLAVMIANGARHDPAVPVDPDSVYAIQYTSGTTGAPKGCMLPHRNKVLSRMSMLGHVGYEEQDRALVFMPLTASLGADMLHTHALRGMATILMQSFDEAEMVRLIASEQVSVLYALESTFDRLIDYPGLADIDWSGLRYFFSTSATRDLSAGVARLKQLPGFNAKFWNAYGCTEGGGWLTFIGSEEIESAVSGLHRDQGLRSIGRECMLARVDCVDENGEPVPTGEIGEMTLSAPWLFAGYWGQPDKTAEALRGERYFTGDLARKDEDGYIYLQGRMKDMIKTGGINVYPAEIEMVLKAHPMIREVAVVGIPDTTWGEKVIACIIAEDDYDEATVTAFAKRELAGFKIPKRFVVMKEFPRDVVGKILKRDLRDQLMLDAETA